MTVDELERAIQSALLDFVNSTGREIEHVRVDTRRFANLSVEVFLVEAKRENEMTNPAAVTLPPAAGLAAARPTSKRSGRAAFPFFHSCVICGAPMAYQRKGTRLTAAEARLFDFIATNPGPASDICENLSLTGPSLRVAVCRLNKKIAPNGYRMKARRGVYSVRKERHDAR